MRPDLALKHVAARGLPDRRAVNPPVQLPWGAILVDEHLRNVRPPPAKSHTLSLTVPDRIEARRNLHSDTYVQERLLATARQSRRFVVTLPGVHVRKPKCDVTIDRPRGVGGASKVRP